MLKSWIICYYDAFNNSYLPFNPSNTRSPEEKQTRLFLMKFKETNKFI